MRRVALRVAYDGTAFRGSQRQRGVRTVEGELLHALAAAGVLEDPASGWFLAASRTDAGVSAAANVFALTTAFPVDGIVGAVNARARDVWVTAVAEVPDGFVPRRSARRAYRYHQWAGDVPDEQAFTDAVREFRGEHDFTSFARVDEGQSPVRRLDVADARRDGDVVACDFAGPSFLWNQIRRIVNAALAVSRGDASLGDVRAALHDPVAHARDFGLAAAEPLVLVDVHHEGVEWRTDLRAAARARDAIARRAAERAVALAVARSIREFTSG